MFQNRIRVWQAVMRTHLPFIMNLQNQDNNDQFILWIEFRWLQKKELQNTITNRSQIWFPHGCNPYPWQIPSGYTIDNRQIDKSLLDVWIQHIVTNMNIHTVHHMVVRRQKQTMYLQPFTLCIRFFIFETHLIIWL